jgi:hypothetical protein
MLASLELLLFQQSDSSSKDDVLPFRLPSSCYHVIEIESSCCWFPSNTALWLAVVVVVVVVVFVATVLFLSFTVPASNVSRAIGNSFF